MRDPEIIFGISPLGGNCEDVDDGTVSGVPLVYDPATGTYISEQALEESEDREYSRELSEESQEEESFRARAGFIKA